MKAPVNVTVRRLGEADIDEAVGVQIDAFDQHDRLWGVPVPEMTPERLEGHQPGPACHASVCVGRVHAAPADPRGRQGDAVAASDAGTAGA
jgi:hypothetical protein